MIIESEFDDFGTYTEPWRGDEPHYNVRELVEYCKKMRKSPIELTQGERERLRTDLFHGFKIIFEDDVEKGREAYKCSGVWAMFGTPKDSTKDEYVCLNVGKCQFIADELRVDFVRLKEFRLIKNKDKPYKNQFNREVFTYNEYSNRLDYIYRDISENYKNIIVILVAKQEEHTYLIEKLFAYCTKSIYGVSNGRYTREDEVSDTEITSIINKTCEDLITKKVEKEILDKILDFAGRAKQENRDLFFEKSVI